MASTFGYLTYVLEQLSDLPDVTYRAMMGEYLLYCRGKVVGGIYDDRLLVKPTEAAKKAMPSAGYERPYKGGREMLLVENMDDRAFLCALIDAMADELPYPNKKAKK